MSIESDQPCVHCGLCLDHCATYRVLGSEADSPRGRVYLMKTIAGDSGVIDPLAARHLDRCLGCLACETACPSGVRFGRRLERAHPAVGGPMRALAAVGGQMMRSRWLLRGATAGAQIGDFLGLGRWRRRIPWLGLLPARPPRPVRLAAGLSPPAAAGRPRVFLLRGCGDVLRPSIFAAAADALRWNGFSVIPSPPGLCCGALARHAGRPEEARRLAAALIDAVERSGADVVATTAAGCGASLRDLEALFHEHPRQPDAARVATIARDVSELLIEAGPRPPAEQPRRTAAVAYHDACHLLHAMKVRDAPRAIVATATGNEPIDLGDNHVCCGSAGSYNLRHHGLAVEIGRAKAWLIRERGAEIVAVGNIGCILQLERAAALEGVDVDIRHPVELLAEAYRFSGVAGS